MDCDIVKTLPLPIETSTALRRVSIGLPANASAREKRFPLTPEAVKWLVENYCEEVKLSVILESGASKGIHYTDARYSRFGARIADRNASLKCDIIITTGSLTTTDIRSLRSGAIWITLQSPASISTEILKAAVERKITVLSLAGVTDKSGNCHISDVLAEIDGRSAITIASGILADDTYGKGILLGGVTGIVPCEVIIIGASIAGIAAAKSAIGTGATVRVFDDDPSLLRHLTDTCAGKVISSSMHREVYMRACAKADIIVNTIPAEKCKKIKISADEATILKNGVIIFDISNSPNTFHSIRKVDLTEVLHPAESYHGERTCFVNPGNAVSRTSSMAISNCLVPLLEKMISSETVTDPIRMESGMRNGLVSIAGKIVNRAAASASGLNYVDPSIFLHLS